MYLITLTAYQIKNPEYISPSPVITKSIITQTAIIAIFRAKIKENLTY